MAQAETQAAAATIDAEKEEKNMKRLARGKMDFFCKPSGKTISSSTGLNKNKSNKLFGNSTKNSSSNSNGNDKRPSSAITSNTTTDGNDVIKKQKVMFKFKQGFSDAVRRPVSIMEFL